MCLVQLRINFICIFKVFQIALVALRSGNFVKSLKIQVKLILICPRAHAITYTNSINQLRTWLNWLASHCRFRALSKLAWLHLQTTITGDFMIYYGDIGENVTSKKKKKKKNFAHLVSQSRLLHLLHVVLGGQSTVPLKSKLPPRVAFPARRDSCRVRRDSRSARIIEA